MRIFLGAALVGLLFFSFIQKVNGQNCTEIFNSKGLKVEVCLLVPKKNSCNPQGREVRFRYRLTGRWSNALPAFVNWSLLYEDCNGRTYRATYSLDLSRFRGEDLSGGIFHEDMDYRFPFKSIVRPPFDFSTSMRNQSGTKRIIQSPSTPPTGIYGPSIIEYGKTVKLGVVGGSLGYGAEWVWYVGGCGSGKEIGRGKVIEVSPNDHVTYFVRAEDPLNKTRCVKLSVEVDFGSTKAERIEGNRKICKGESTILKAGGGRLGKDAWWAWYKDACGGKLIGQGERIEVRPSVTTTYYLRAESHYNITKCEAITVEVMEPVEVPDRIIGSGSNICRGEKVKLGFLDKGTDPTVGYNWYAGSPNGVFVGSGTTITVSPKVSTTYYLQPDVPCYSGQAPSFRVEVAVPSTVPRSITQEEGGTVRGEEVKLRANGGALGTGANFLWYKNQCGGNPVGEGRRLIIPVRGNTEFFVRAVGDCGTTDCISIKVEPEPRRKTSRFPDRQQFLQFGFRLGLEWLNFPVQSIAGQTPGPSTAHQFQVNGLGIGAGLVVHPLLKPHFSWGVLSSFSAGISPYQLGSGRPMEQGIYTATYKERYTYTRLNIGSDLAFGFPAFKLYGLVNKTFANDRYSRRRFNDGTWSTSGKRSTELLGIGLRFGRYTPKKSWKKRGGVFDLYYTLSREVSPGNWFSLNEDWPSFSGARSGLGVSWWLQNAFRLVFQMTLATRQRDLDVFNLDFRGASYGISLRWTRDWFF